MNISICMLTKKSADKKGTLKRLIQQRGCIIKISKTFFQIQNKP